MTPRIRRNFDTAFKLQVVQMIREHGLSVAQVCRDQHLVDTEVIQQMIDQWQEKAQTTRLCRLLGVSRSGLYASRRRRSAPAACALAAPLQAAFQASGGNYGSRRLSASLKAQGLQAGRHRVRRLMKQQGLKARWKRKFVHTTDRQHDLPVAANVLGRHFNPDAPDRAWQE